MCGLGVACIRRGLSTHRKCLYWAGSFWGSVGCESLSAGRIAVQSPTLAAPRFLASFPRAAAGPVLSPQRGSGGE